ncbi:hypothetical protein [Kitasatospora indigofera]|uniref:hypothetical protein n=1 Tax=Kitasatospora indigofera TaxID=67307 RepID=UPI0033B9AC16
MSRRASSSNAAVLVVRHQPTVVRAPAEGCRRRPNKELFQAAAAMPEPLAAS